MYIPYSFMWENTRYLTLIGIERDDYLDLTEVKNFKNAIPWFKAVSGDPKAMPNLERQAGVKAVSIPIVTASSFEEKDGYYLISGNLDGKEVKLTEDTLYVDGTEVCSEAEISRQEVDSEVEEQVTVEDISVPEETTEESQILAESTGNLPEPELEKHVLLEEPIQVEDIETDRAGYFDTVSKEISETVTAVGQETDGSANVSQFEINQKPAVTEEESFYGVKAGKRTVVSDKEVLLGSASVDASLEIGKELVTSRYTAQPHLRRSELSNMVQPAKSKTRYPWQRVEDIEEVEMIKPEQPFVPSGTPTVVPMLYVETSPGTVPTVVPTPNIQIENKDGWEQAKQLAPSPEVEPKDVAPEEPITAAPDVNKELKEAFRTTLTPEVNKVIGDIPHAMLGAIDAWTSNDIDHAMLKEQGETYCIDHRWQKCGKWYCIDIVNHYVRYFYNMKLGVSIEIPIATCKEWLNIVSGNTQ